MTSPGSRPLLGIALISAMALCFASMDNTVRWLGSATPAALPVLLMLSARYLFQAVAMALWLGFDHRLSFRSEHPRFQALRGLLLVATSGFSFFGVQRMPVPEFTAINMLTPVLVTLLAAWLLHERVSRWRWALVGAAFAGDADALRLPADRRRCARRLVALRPPARLLGLGRHGGDRAQRRNERLAQPARRHAQAVAGCSRHDR